MSSESVKICIKLINLFFYILLSCLQDDDDDDNDFSGPALGGHVKTHSDVSDDDDDDKPVTMRSAMMRASGNHLDVPTSKKPFKMEVFDL